MESRAHGCCNCKMQSSRLLPYRFTSHNFTVHMKANWLWLFNVYLLRQLSRITCSTSTMPIYCCVPDCNSRTGTSDRNRGSQIDLSDFHLIPSQRNEPSLRRKWIEAIAASGVGTWKPQSEVHTIHFRLQRREKRVPQVRGDSQRGVFNASRRREKSLRKLSILRTLNEVRGTTLNASFDAVEAALEKLRQDRTRATS